MPDTALARVRGLLVPARRSYAGKTHWAPLRTPGVDEPPGPLYVGWSLCGHWTPTEVTIPGVTVDCRNCLRAATCDVCGKPATHRAWQSHGHVLLVCPEHKEREDNHA
ncbi:MAG TPA: hypothetical protein VIS06_20650 [Mycobacteriales bacterium]|jgi:hypothetical protein